MDSNKVKISAMQLGILLIVTIIGVGILTLPRNVVEIAGPDGWILILLAGAFTMVLSLVLYSLAKRFPTQTIIEYSRDLVGRPLSVLIGVIFVTYYVIFSAFCVRIFGEVLKMFLLPKTPIEVITITFLLATSYLVRNGLEGVVRFYEIMIILMFVPYFLSLISGAPQGDFTNMLPVFQTSPTTLLQGTFEIVFSFIGFEVLLLFAPFVSNQKSIKKTLIIAISIITLIYIGSTVTVLATFGAYETKNLIWPLMSYIKSIQVPGAFIEQLEGVIMTIWVMFIYTTLATIYFAAAFICSKLSKTKEHSIFVIALLPITYILSLLPENVAQLYDWLGTFSIYAGALVNIVIPMFLLIVAKVRKKGVEANG